MTMCELIAYTFLISHKLLVKKKPQIQYASQAHVDLCLNNFSSSCYWVFQTHFTIGMDKFKRGNLASCIEQWEKLEVKNEG